MKEDFFDEYLKDEILYGMDDYDEVYGNRGWGNYTSSNDKYPSQELRVILILLAVFVGFLGIHRFFAGKYFTGIIIFIFGYIALITHSMGPLALPVAVVLLDLYKLFKDTSTIKKLGLYHIYYLVKKIVIKTRLKVRKHQDKVLQKKVFEGKITFEQYKSGVYSSKSENEKDLLLLAIFLGPLGVHRFVMKRVPTGLLMIFVTFFVAPIIATLPISLDMGWEYIVFFIVSYLWTVIDIINMLSGKFDIEPDIRETRLKMIAIFLGPLGIHRFITRKYISGIVMISITFIAAPLIVMVLSYFFNWDIFASFIIISYLWTFIDVIQIFRHKFDE